jgi:hypothetical protein
MYKHKIKSIKFKHFCLSFKDDSENTLYFLDCLTSKNAHLKKKTYLKRSFFFKSPPKPFFKKKFISGGGSFFKVLLNLNEDLINSLGLIKNAPGVFYNNSSYRSSHNVLNLFLKVDSKIIFTEFLLKSFSFKLNLRPFKSLESIKKLKKKSYNNAVS